MLITLAAMALAMFGDSLGLWPTAITFTDGAITVTPGMVEMPANGMWMMLVIGHLLTVVVPALAVAGTRDAHVATERRIIAHAWTVQQLVPESVRRQYGGANGVISDVEKSDSSN